MQHRHGGLRVSKRDADLVKRAKQGDPDAFREIYEQTYSKIYSYVYYRVTDRETAEDIAAEVFVRLVRKIDTYQDRGRPLLAWLYTIAGNLVRDFHRRNSRVQWMPIEDRELVSDDVGPSAATNMSLDRDMLADAINQLTEDQAQVVLLKFVEGRSNAEVAEMIGKNEGSVKSLQHRAIRAMRRYMESTQVQVDD